MLLFQIQSFSDMKLSKEHLSNPHVLTSASLMYAYYHRSKILSREWCCLSAYVFPRFSGECKMCISKTERQGGPKKPIIGLKGLKILRFFDMVVYSYYPENNDSAHNF
jgi:hypothetical protein